MKIRLRNDAGLNGNLTWRPLLNEEEIALIENALPTLDASKMGIDPVKVKKSLMAMRQLPTRDEPTQQGSRRGVHGWGQLSQFTGRPSMYEVPSIAQAVDALGWGPIKAVAEQGEALEKITRALWLRSKRHASIILHYICFSGAATINARYAKKKWAIEGVDTQSRLADGESFAVFVPPLHGELGGFLAAYGSGVFVPLKSARLFESAAAAKRQIGASGLRLRNPAVVRVHVRVTAMDPIVESAGQLTDLMGAVAQEERRQLEDSLLLARKEDLEARLAQLNAQMKQASGTGGDRESVGAPRTKGRRL